PVAMHDADLSRSTDGHGFVHELTLSELKGLDAAPGRPERAEIPTVREAVELASGRVGVDLEIKNIPGDAGFDSPREAALEAALRELETASFSGDVLISSFNWLTIERSRELAPDIPTGFLTIAPIEPRAALVYARGAGTRAPAGSPVARRSRCGSGPGRTGGTASCARAAGAAPRAGAGSCGTPAARGSRPRSRSARAGPGLPPPRGRPAGSACTR